MLQNPSNPTCIDLFLTNAPRSFQSACVLETGLSIFYLITMADGKSFKTFQPKIITCRSYKKFSNDTYR